MPLLAVIVVAGVGFAIGLAVGRWWAILTGVPLWIWAVTQSEVDEVPAEFLASAITAIFVAGVAAGVGVRRGRTPAGGP